MSHLFCRKDGPLLLLNGESLSKAYGIKQLFKKISISIFEGNQIGMIGENGSGKSTLLKILAGKETADQGKLSSRRGLKIGYVPQTCIFPEKKPIEILLDALADDPHLPDYDKERIAKTWLSKLGFTGEEPLAPLLSGGWRTRLMLAREMVTSPDLLLLDEPTNHLDLEGIIWLEKFLKKEVPTYLLVSHDRSFLQNSANRIIEISHAYPQGLFSFDGSFEAFLEAREQFLQGQLQQERSLASKARREVEWLRSNPKARTTKSQARIDQAHELLEDLSDVQKRNLKQKAAIDFTSSNRETRKLLVAKNLSKTMGDRLLFKGLDFTLSPGTRIGLMGPNGSGKTTLLRILAEEISADLGTIKRAEALKTVYFDQHRNQLPDTLSLRDALSPTGDFVQYRGQAIHVNGWCKRFLFSPDHLDLPIGKLSGGERARIAIAHLMLQPADLLLLDEPTNDLDIPTLEILEASLIDFPGAVVLITHDRYMLDRICNAFLAFGDPFKTEIYADYAQWEASAKGAELVSKPKAAVVTEKPSTTKQKLSYMEKREYDQIEEKLLKLEAEKDRLTKELEALNSAQSSETLHDVCVALSTIEEQIDKLYSRWDELDKQIPR